MNGLHVTQRDGTNALTFGPERHYRETMRTMVVVVVGAAILSGCNEQPSAPRVGSQRTAVTAPTVASDGGTAQLDAASELELNPGLSALDVAKNESLPPELQWQQLVSDAAGIAVMRCSQKTSRFHPPNQTEPEAIVTDIKLIPVEVLHGEVEEIVSQRGGSVGTAAFTVSHQPLFVVGYDYVVFFESLEDDVRVITHAGRLVSGSFFFEGRMIPIASLRASISEAL